MLSPTNSTHVIENEDLMRSIRKDLYDHEMKILSIRTGIHASTLNNIRSGRTKWPRHVTLLTLIHVLGYELWLIKKS